MHVSDLLAGKGAAVATVTSHTLVGDVVAELARHRVGALVVSPDGRHIEGIVSERDIVRHLSEVRSDLLDDPVSTIMSTEVSTCRPDDDVESIMAADDGEADPARPGGRPTANWSGSSASATS